jgi:hypothetical protein
LGSLSLDTVESIAAQLHARGALPHSIQLDAELPADRAPPFCVGVDDLRKFLRSVGHHIIALPD